MLPCFNNNDAELTLTSCTDIKEKLTFKSCVFCVHLCCCQATFSLLPFLSSHAQINTHLPLSLGGNVKCALSASVFVPVLWLG